MAAVLGLPRLVISSLMNMNASRPRPEDTIILAMLFERIEQPVENKNDRASVPAGRVQFGAS